MIDSSMISSDSSYLTPQNDGKYQLRKPLGEGWFLNYSNLEDEEFKLQNSIKIQDELDAKDAKIVVNEESVDVYTTVEYRGKPTIQKYTSTELICNYLKALPIRKGFLKKYDNRHRAKTCSLQLIIINKAFGKMPEIALTYMP